MGKLIPLLFLLVGIGGGVGAGLMLAPEPPICPAPGDTVGVEVPEGCPDPAAKPEPEAEDDNAGTAEFVRMNDQFIIPVLDDGVVRSLVVLSLSLEVDLGTTGAVFAIEPRLRDGFMRVLFDHANSGGFDGAYTAAGPMDRLRRALLEVAVKFAGNAVRDVLILDLLRQEV